MRLKIHFFLCFLLHFPAVELWAQIEWDNPAFQITSYDGLPSTYYKDFEEDEYGFLWIATYSGICRFDGIELNCLDHPALPEDGISEIAYDAHRKVLWIGTFRGLYAYHILTETVKRYHISGHPSGLQILTMCLDVDHQLWVGMRANLGKLSGDADSLEIIDINTQLRPKSKEYLNAVKYIYPDPVNEEYLWLSTQGGVLRMHRPTERFEYYNPRIGNVENLSINQIFSPKNSRYLYFGVGQSNTIPNAYNYLIYDAQANKHVHSIKINELWHNRKITAYQDSIVFLSTSAGLIRYNHLQQDISKTWINDKTQEHNYTVSYIDQKHNIWSGSSDELSMYNSGTAHGKRYYYSADYPDWYHVPTALLIDSAKHTLFMPVYGGEGLYAFDYQENKWTTYPFLDPKNGSIRKTDFITMGRLDDQRQLIFAHSGIYEINEQKQIVKSSYNIPGYISPTRAMIDVQQNLWMTVNKKGVIKYNLKDHSQEQLNEQVHYCHTSPNSFFYEDSRKNVWIGGFCGGFDVYEQATGKIHSFPFPRESKELTTVAEYDGWIWAQVEDGFLMKIKLDELDKGIVATVDLETETAKGNIQLINDDAFSNSSCLSGTFDRLGRLWFLSEKGLYCYDTQQARLELFGKNVGLNVNGRDMNVFSSEFLRLMPNGKMVYSTRKGICIFDPENISNQQEHPEAYITAIHVNNQPLKKDSSSFFKTFYQLQPRENFVGFDFSALSFTSPFKTKFLYKLVGVDEDWKDPGNKRYVSYTQLKGGHYDFLLKAAGAAGVWQNEPVKVSLQIAMFWYQTAWAKGLGLASIIFGVLFSYFSRLSRAIEKEHLKTAYERDLAELKMQALTAQMNPHFIFNSLNSIDFYIIKNDTRNASQYLNRFSRLMRLILKNSRSNYVSLKDDLDALQLYLEIEALRFNHQFEHEIRIDPNIDQDYFKIPPMLIQPYVENAIWHGLLHKKENGKISIKLHLDEENETLHCVVIDNGIGRKKSMENKTQNSEQKKRKSFGMNITKDKIEAINFLHDMNASVVITDLYDPYEQGIGTKVELIIPI